MYVMVSDPAGSHVFKVSPIGPMVSFSQPEVQLDPLSDLHLIYQSGAKTFTYSVVNPDGTILLQDIYDYVDKRPRLALNPTGDVVVIGGVRRLKPGELPVVKLPADLPPPAKP